MKTPIILSALLLLTSCGGGSSGGSTNDSPEPESHVVSSIGATQTITSNNPIELTVSGEDNTITVDATVSSLIVSGTGNLLIFIEPDVDECTISGTNNTAETSTGGSADLGCDITGTDNSGF